MVQKPVDVVNNKSKPKTSQKRSIAPRDDTEAEAKAFIYLKESTNRLDAENEYGCRGLGQDCNNILHIQCPDWKTNRACQEEFWHNYMKRRYGSWIKAKQHWLARVPINGKDVGNWW